MRCIQGVGDMPGHFMKPKRTRGYHRALKRGEEWARQQRDDERLFVEYPYLRAIVWKPNPLATLLKQSDPKMKDHIIAPLIYGMTGEDLGTKTKSSNWYRRLIDRLRRWSLD